MADRTVRYGLRARLSARSQVGGRRVAQEEIDAPQAAAIAEAGLRATGPEQGGAQGLRRAQPGVPRVQVGPDWPGQGHRTEGPTLGCAGTRCCRPGTPTRASWSRRRPAAVRAPSWRRAAAEARCRAEGRVPHRHGAPGAGGDDGGDVPVPAGAGLHQFRHPSRRASLTACTGSSASAAPCTHPAAAPALRLQLTPPALPQSQSPRQG